MIIVESGQSVQSYLFSYGHLSAFQNGQLTFKDFDAICVNESNIDSERKTIEAVLKSSKEENELEDSFAGNILEEYSEHYHNDRANVVYSWFISKRSVKRSEWSD